MSVFQCADFIATILASMFSARVVASLPREEVQATDRWVIAKTKERVQQDKGSLSASLSFLGTRRMALLADFICEINALRWLLSRLGFATKCAASRARLASDLQNADVADSPTHGDAVVAKAASIRNRVCVYLRFAPLMLENSVRAVLYH